PTPLAFSFHYSIDPSLSFSFFFFNDTATTEIYTLSLHDALPIWGPGARRSRRGRLGAADARPAAAGRCGLPSRRPVHRRVYRRRDRKSTRLNSSHVAISYAVFCLKKKKTKQKESLYDM